MILLWVLVNPVWQRLGSAPHRCEMPPVSCLDTTCFTPLTTFPKTAPSLFLFHLEQLGLFWCSQQTPMEHPIFSCAYIQMRIKIIQESRVMKCFLKEIPIIHFVFAAMTPWTSLPHSSSALGHKNMLAPERLLLVRTTSCQETLDIIHIWKQGSSGTKKAFQHQWEPCLCSLLRQAHARELSWSWHRVTPIIVIPLCLELWQCCCHITCSVVPGLIRVMH